MSTVKKIAVNSISIAVQPGVAATRDTKAIPPKTVEAAPGDKILLTDAMAKSLKNAVRDPSKDEANGEFRDLTKIETAGNKTSGSTSAANGDRKGSTAAAGTGATKAAGDAGSAGSTTANEPKSPGTGNDKNKAGDTDKDITG